MLIKEYRICVPLSVEEYRIAQLYMIQKKSREESSGTGSGVEILINEPYSDGPGGSGQYTHKVYHIGSHLPGWFRAILPKSALRVEEEAWNAYPYTKTIYRCPFIEKFTLEIETKYESDGGDQENVFDMSKSELRSRVVDYLDFVKDPISSGDYKKEEDPLTFQSERTGRGPLTDNWREEYATAQKDPSNKTKSILCAYKLCRVEFRYWGMQSKIERFIHDIGLRKTMLRAHRQVWAWQDEYYGLTMDDIRALERETQLALQEKYKEDEEGGEGGMPGGLSPQQISIPEKEGSVPPPDVTQLEREPVRRRSSRPVMSNIGVTRKSSWENASSKKQGTNDQWRVESIEQLLQADSSDDEEFYDAQEDLVSDTSSYKSCPGMFRSSSMEMISTPDEEYQDTNMAGTIGDEKGAGSSVNRRIEQYRQLQSLGMSQETSLPGTPTLTTTHSCKTTILFLVLHGGSMMDAGADEKVPKHSDIATLRQTFETVMKAHYPAMLGHIALRYVSVGNVCSDTLALLASLSPYAYDAQSPTIDNAMVANENFPVSAVPLLMTGSTDYADAVAKLISRANHVYSEFLSSEDGLAFNGQVCLIGDSVGALVGFDALCKNNPYLNMSHASSQMGSHGSLHEEDETSQEQPQNSMTSSQKHSHSNPDLTVTDPNQQTVFNGEATTQTDKQSRDKYTRHTSCPSSRRTSTGSQSDIGKLDFEVTDFFMLGCPLGVVLGHRKMCKTTERSLPTMQFLDPLAAALGNHFYSAPLKCHDDLPRPSCHQLYNLFYPSDPSAVRLEPLVLDKVKQITPVKIPRYQNFPLGDGQSLHVVETIQANSQLFADHSPQPSPSPISREAPSLERRQSNMSITSQMSGHGELTAANLAAITNKWWGNKRLDYALYYPEALQNFPNTALPYLLHASFWESTDVVSFILRQVVRQEYMSLQQESGMREAAMFKPSQPREKWLKRRTPIKIKNVSPNHRANDVITLEDKQQGLSARFMYGPLDMVSLSGEKVDTHIMTNPPNGEWVYFGTETTEGNGRCNFKIPDDKRLTQGLYPVKMVVRGDHTSVDFCLAVLPHKTETVVFSIDGSFTASVSIMGKDPKVRPGAVDVVRHWQELGYLIMYITARPDMQQRKVTTWLAQHNFPHGVVAFMDGLSADPLRQKANFLKQRIQEADIQIHAAYGSGKDIAVYNSIGLQAHQIFIIGKVSKKQYKEANVICEGYATHLTDLATLSVCRPASGNARMFLRKSCFSLPGQNPTAIKKKVRKAISLPHRSSFRENMRVKEELAPTIAISTTGNTVVESGGPAGNVARSRGMSPHPRNKVTPPRLPDER